MTNGTERVTARVQGRVQGVGYRFFTRSEARRLGLTGWVRNEADGSVSVAAEGPRTDLELLVERLIEGPPGAAVRNVDVHWEAAKHDATSFDVRH